MTMTYKITFADLGWYEVKAESRGDATAKALYAAQRFHPELRGGGLRIERVEVLEK